LSQDEWKIRQGKLLFAHTDDWLDRSLGASYLKEAKLANKVVEAMEHFAGERYDLFAFVVMPSHFHWVFQPRENWVQGLTTKKIQRTPRERIMHTLKLHTALECNRLLECEGTFWQDESYDHCVFDEEELGRIIQYVENNPVRAGLCAAPEAWLWSSAKLRHMLQITYGQPLPRGSRREDHVGRLLQIPYGQPLPRGAGCQPAF
jgi:putative transposase